MDEAAQDTETEASAPVEEAAPAPTRAGRRRVNPFAAVTAVIVAGLVAALIVTQVQLGDRDSLNGDRTSAIAAARIFAADVSTYDYRHLQRDFGKVENESTSSFRHTFVSSSKGLSTLLGQYHAVAKATVLDAGLVSITPSTAVVILFVNQSISNTAQKGPSTTDSRIKVSMVRSGGRWLLNDLKVL